MNRSAKRQRHDLARRKHKQEAQHHAREAARKPRSAFPKWMLAGAVAVILGFIFVVAFGK